MPVLTKFFAYIAGIPNKLRLGYRGAGVLGLESYCFDKESQQEKLLRPVRITPVMVRRVARHHDPEWPITRAV